MEKEKRKYIIDIFDNITTDERWYPKEFRRKKGRVKFWFRRECWINNSNYHQRKYGEYRYRIIINLKGHTNIDS